jgi:hypothetical protein
MPLASFSEIDECIGKDYNGDFLVRYDASQWINMNKLIDNVESMNNRLITVETMANVESRFADMLQTITDLKQEIYDLQQRIETYEMSSGEN